jgi:Protein of unknown function (DUF4065)
MQFNREKLKAVILETCFQCPPERLGAVKMHKVLYFLDMLQFALAGNAVTAATYRKRPYGPTCVQLLPTLREMEISGDISIKDVDFFGMRKREYHANKMPPSGVLNDNEQALLKEVIDFVCHQHSAKDISEVSHQRPWEMVEFGEDIPYSTALMLFPTDPSPEAFEVIEQGASEIEAARSKSNTLGLSKLSDFRSRVLAAHGQV